MDGRLTWIYPKIITCMNIFILVEMHHKIPVVTFVTPTAIDHQRILIWLRSYLFV